MVKIKQLSKTTKLLVKSFVCSNTNSFIGIKNDSESGCYMSGILGILFNFEFL